MCPTQFRKPLMTRYAIVAFILVGQLELEYILLRLNVISECVCVDTQNTSDLKFVIENRPIHVHKAILKIRLDLLNMCFAVLLYMTRVMLNVYMSC